MKTTATLLLAFCLTLAACASHRTVTNLPPGVANAQVNNWISATTDLQNAQAATHTAFVGAVELNRSGVIPDGQAYGETLTALGRATQLEIEFAQFLNTVPNNWSLSTSAKATTYVNQILAQLTAANAGGLLNVKNPATGTALSDLLGTAVKLLTLIEQIKAASVMPVLVPFTQEA